MERYTVFLDGKDQYCSNDHITQGSLQIQCNLYQNTNGIFHRTRTNNFYGNTKFVWKHKNPQQPKQSRERRTDLKKSHFLASGYAPKLQ